MVRMAKFVRENGDAILTGYRVVISVLAGFSAVMLMNIYEKIKLIDSIESDLKVQQEITQNQKERITKLESVVFVPSWNRHAQMESHEKETDKLIQHTTELIREADSLNNVIDFSEYLLSNN